MDNTLYRWTNGENLKGKKRKDSYWRKKDGQVQYLEEITIPDDIKQAIMEIMRDNITFSPQLDAYVVHGAVEKIAALCMAERDAEENNNLRYLVSAQSGYINLLSEETSKYASFLHAHRITTEDMVVQAGEKYRRQIDGMKKRLNIDDEQLNQPK